MYLANYSANYRYSKHACYPKVTKREAPSLLAKDMRSCDIARRLEIPKPKYHHAVGTQSILIRSECP